MNTPAGRHRIRFTVRYDGAKFYGWQLQPDQRTVQGEIERVLSRLFDAPARVIGSGRTDRGVHAYGQVAAVDAPSKWDAPALERAMNALLPGEIRVTGAVSTNSTFHPRYDAISRAYIYRVGTTPAASSPFEAPWCWPLRVTPDMTLLKSTAAQVVGDHSFIAFAKAGQEERGDRCFVTEARWSLWRDIGIEYRIEANRFLHHMVRYLVGTQIAIALGQRPLDDFAALLAGEPHLKTSPPAPPQGLFLASVSYPEMTRT